MARAGEVPQVRVLGTLPLQLLTHNPTIFVWGVVVLFAALAAAQLVFLLGH